MNIALQLAREDFAANFCATLQHFLRWRDERDYRVTWNGPSGRGVAILYVHPRLGIAVPEWTDPRELGFVWRELRGGKNLVESVARRAYLAAHLAPGPSRRALAAHTVTIDPTPGRFSNGFYVPGGNQVRWFDTSERRCYVALKRGFPERYFRAQVDVRRRPETPAPTLLQVDDEALVFCEEIVTGRARVDAALPEREQITAAALAALGRLAEATAEETSASAYASEVASAIESHVDGRVATADAKRAVLLAKRLAAAVGSESITTVISHGDLSLGHVLIDRLAPDAKPVLVDWEHAARRQRSHDALTIRYRHQLPDRFRAALGNCAASDPLRLYLLEALLFHAREADNPMLTAQSTGLTPFTDALESLLPRFA